MSTQARLIQLDRRDLRKVVEALPESNAVAVLRNLDQSETEIQQISNQIAALQAQLVSARDRMSAAKRQAVGFITQNWTQDEISEAMWLALSRHGPAILAGIADRQAALAAL